MGVEKFFNTLLSSYKEKLITSFKKSSADILFFDFNSIIHKISSQTVSDLNYLYKILLISDKNPSKKLIDFFENKYQHYKNIFYLSIDFLHTPSCIKQLIEDIKKIDINVVIIHQIIKQIEYYISNISDLQLVYISIDGVPTIGKILEQRHRRYIGEIINYKNQQTISSFNFKDLKDLPYNFKEYNETKFSFHKLHISPQTNFMKKLIKSIKNHIFPVNVQINDDTMSGEGEFKIINYIRNYNDLFIEKKIIIYSPDSDMILLSSILPHDIFILRYDQQKNEDFIMSTELFKKIILEYILENKNTIENQNIINDIIFIFTIFGDDFIPKLDSIPINHNFEKILKIYKSLNTIKNGYILNESEINLNQLKLFFTELEKLELPNIIKQFNIKENSKDIYSLPDVSYLRKKESSFNNDPIDGKIINELNKNIHDSNYLEGEYSIEFKLDKPKKYTPETPSEYINGLKWIYNYYFLNNIDYSWYYPYEKTPYIHEINIYLNSLDQDKWKNKNISDSYPLIFSPIEQTIYTSPINITTMLSKKYQSMTKEFYSKIGDLSNILDKIQLIDCTSSNYLSKCSLKNIDHPIYKLSPSEFIKKFRTNKTTNEFMKYVKYYTITNDPFFYNYIKNNL
jgi:5'-3' exonuclease